VLTQRQVRQIRKLAAQGLSYRQIADEVAAWLGRPKVSFSWIGQIVRGETYAED
jgi:hypothetical protein